MNQDVQKIEKEDTIDLRAAFVLVRRQMRLILLTMAAVVGLASVYLFQATPLYTATALVMVDTSYKNLLESVDGQPTSAISDAAKLESEVIILKSPRVLLETMQKANLMNDPEFGPSLSLGDKIRVMLGIDLAGQIDPARAAAATLAKLQNAVTVQRNGLTYVLNLSVTSQSPDRSAMLVNTLAKTYIDLQIKSKVNLALGSRDLLQGQLDAAQGALADSERNLDQYIGENIDSISQETGSEDLRSLSEQVAKLEADRLTGENIQPAIDQALVTQDWSTLTDSLQNDAMRALDKQRRDIEKRITEAAPDSDEKIALTDELNVVQAELAKTAEKAVSGFKADLTTLSGRSNDMRQELRTKVLSSKLSGATLTALYGLQQEADISQKQYTNLISRMRDLEAQAVVQVADSRVVSDALPPRSRTSPNSKMILILSLVTGLLGGVGLAFVNEFYIGGITSVSQLENVLPIPVAGTIPHTEMRRDQASVADNIVLEPLSIYAESFRKLRAVVDQSVRGKDAESARQCKVIMVSSAVPGEGKTSISLSLARTYAMAGKKTLLIDADLRKPSLHKHLLTEPSEGFLNYLQNREFITNIEEILSPDTLTRAMLVLGGGRSSEPTDQLLQSDFFLELVEIARSQLDIVVIDTSPLVPVVDARYIAPHVDAAIMVTRFGTTMQSDLRTSYSQLADSINPNAKIFAVLSMDEQKGRSYRYDGYYASYTSD